MVKLLGLAYHILGFLYGDMGRYQEAAEAYRLERGKVSGRIEGKICFHGYFVAQDNVRITYQVIGQESVLQPGAASASVPGPGTAPESGLTTAPRGCDRRSRTDYQS